MFDPQTDLFIGAIRHAEHLRQAETERALAAGPSPRRRALAATMRRMADHLDPSTMDDHAEGLPA